MPVPSGISTSNLLHGLAPLRLHEHPAVLVLATVFVNPQHRWDLVVVHLVVHLEVARLPTSLGPIDFAAAAASVDGQ